MGVLGEWVAIPKTPNATHRTPLPPTYPPTQIVYGNPEVYGEPVVTFLNATADGGAPVSGDEDAEGEFC